jgi:hypothetical protein
MLRRVIERGYLNTVSVVKQNENAYGQLFIDGQVVSRIRTKQIVRHPLDRKSARRDKKSTPPQGKVNAKKRKS